MSPSITPDRTVFTVTELVDQARDCLETAFNRVWVEGEISNFKRHSSGHYYFTIKDSGSQLHAAMFRGSNRLMRFLPEDGMQVVACGRLSIYTGRGDFQIIVESMEPAGLGALQLAFEQLKNRLAKEGLFDPSRKKSLPEFPRRIAVVTSPTGAAIQDILNVTGRRMPLADIDVYPVRVQGEGAAQEISQALRRLNEAAESGAGGWDVIICGRGGGSLEDLWAFNEEIVARAIAESKIPVISAVGHEVDYTIADFAADVRAETPTAAAEMVVRDRRELMERISGQWRMLSSRMNDRLRELRRRLEHAMACRTLQEPRRVFEPLAQRLDDLQAALQTALGNRVRLGQERLRGLTAQLDALSPLKVMGRGYALVYRAPGQELVRDAAVLKPGDPLKIRFMRGEAIARVEKKSDASGPSD